MKKIAFLFPGQGAQYPGMMKDFAEAFPIAKETFEEADDLLQKNLSALVFNGPAEELTLTKNSQEAIYVASMAVLRVVAEQFPDLLPAVCAGLSLGEYTALTASRKISFANCLPLVASRGAYMHEACLAFPGGMQVVLGLSADDVAKAIASLANVWVANVNCPGQVVIAGTKEGMETVMEPLKSAGAKRVLPLEVAGAFHSGLMQSARERLEPHIAKVSLRESPAALVMNVPGGLVRDLSSMRQHLIDQVTNPVRWEQGIRSMMDMEIELYIEMGPGETLKGMNKRIGVPVPTISIGKVEDLEGISKI